MEVHDNMNESFSPNIAMTRPFFIIIYCYDTLVYSLRPKSTLKSTS